MFSQSLSEILILSSFPHFSFMSLAEGLSLMFHPWYKTKSYFNQIFHRAAHFFLTEANTAGMLGLYLPQLNSFISGWEKKNSTTRHLNSNKVHNDIHSIWNCSMHWSWEANVNERRHFLSCQMWSHLCHPLCITTFVPLAPVGRTIICFKLAALQAAACSHGEDWYLGCRSSHERRG